MYITYETYFTGLHAVLIKVKSHILYFITLNSMTSNFQSFICGRLRIFYSSVYIALNRS